MPSEGSSKRRSPGVVGTVIGGGLVVATVLAFTLFNTDTEATSVPSSTLPGSQGTAGSPGAPSEDPPEASGSSESSVGNLPEKIIIDPASVLGGARAVVNGLGGGVVFSSYSGSPPETGTFFEGGDANCGFTRGLAIDLVGPGWEASYEFDPETFTAGIRHDQYNHVSIAASEGVITGGFSIGSEGRGNSQQWIIEEGELLVEVTDVKAENPELDYPAAFTIQATWSGTSIENYTSQEAAGTVIFECVFLVIPD